MGTNQRERSEDSARTAARDAEECACAPLMTPARGRPSNAESPSGDLTTHPAQTAARVDPESGDALPSPVQRAVSMRPGRTCLSASETRVLALAIQRTPIPGLTKGAIARRWRVGPDTVRNVLRAVDVDPGGGKDLEIPLTDILFCEGVSDPLETWLFAGSNVRKILSADLITLDEWIAQRPKKIRRHKTKYYRALKEGRLPSIRIGNSHRFRPTSEDGHSSAASAWEARA